MDIDPAEGQIPVRPAVHYTMGGIPTDIRTATSLAGLFAAGECSSVGIHGANRLGSNSLAELFVFGHVAGDEAVKFAKGASAADAGKLIEQAKASAAKVLALRDQKGGGERHADLRKEMAVTMEQGCGIYRTAPEMQATCDKLAELKRRYRDITIEDRSSVWNTDWLSALELGYQLEVAEAVALSALMRKESRGAHQRLDGFENRDDANFLAHSLAHYREGAAPEITYGPVKITKSQPAQRAYGALGEALEAKEAKRMRPMSEAAIAEKIVELRILRYRPASDDKPSFGSFKVPYTDDMSVLQALQTIKDTLDGTLSFRWSCRMAVCGSCGMMINGKPQLACNTFIRNLPQGPDHGRAAEQLPDRARPRRVGRRLRQEDREHLSLHHPQEAEDRSRTGPISRPPRRWSPTNCSATASTACCATPPARNSAKIRISSAPAPWRCCSATTATRATAARSCASTRSTARTACGPARRSASAPRSAPSMSTPPTPSIRTRPTARSTSSCAS